MLFLILRDGILGGGWVVLDSSLWRHVKNISDEKYLYN